MDTVWCQEGPKIASKPAHELRDYLAPGRRSSTTVICVFMNLRYSFSLRTMRFMKVIPPIATEHQVGNRRRLRAHPLA